MESGSSSGATLPEGDVYDNQWEALGAWFLGPKAENGVLLQELVREAVQGHIEFRQNFFPSDEKYITDQIQGSQAYKTEAHQMRTELARINKDLQRTVPFFSPRYQAHMNWDTSMPANIGYIAGLLYNQNNVAAEGGPVTTLMELEVGEQLCDMLGYNTRKKDEPQAWGHIACGGTVANIEATWCARNLKFFPIAVQQAIKEEPKLRNAANFQVYVPREGTRSAMRDINRWDLLNLDVDDVIKMGEDVMELAGINTEEFDDIMKKYTLPSLGMFRFMTENNLKEGGIVITPASKHYSWPKAMTLLGLGDKNLFPCALDENGRQDMEFFEQILSYCLANEIPVIMAVAVIGTTEEGAIDPIDQMIEIRNKFRSKGLNFCIHADAAWGGYFRTMISIQENLRKSRKKKKHKEYIFSSSLNDHTIAQLQALPGADSITIDPHKTGLIPYPAGALCYRNGSMRGFVTLTAPVVYHGGTDPNVGVFGVEGSKPGAAAVAILLSHRTIGLDRHGYGRILSQCMTGAKLFYCLWTILAEKDDPFICVNLKSLPDNMDLETSKEFIRTRILTPNCQASNAHLNDDQEVLDFLAKIGPDAMVNAFAVNIKGNKDINIANNINMLIFRKLVYSNALKDNQRVPFIITQSQKTTDIGKKSLKIYKQRLDLPEDGDEPFTFLINTILNPWCNPQLVMEHEKRMKEAILVSIGQIVDKPHNHGFISAGLITDDGIILGDHLPVFTETVHQYHAIAKFKFTNLDDVQVFRSKQEELASLPSEKRTPVIFGNSLTMSLPDLILSEGWALKMDCFAGLPSETNPPFLSTDAVVVDVVRFQHFDMTKKMYPPALEYWMFSHEDQYFMSHVMSVRPDMHQLVQLDAKPHGVPDQLLNVGLPVTIPSLSGSPQLLDNELTDPLELPEYIAEFVGPLGKLTKTTLKIADDRAKIWTDFTELNVDHHHHHEDEEAEQVEDRENLVREDSSGLVDYDVQAYMNPPDSRMYGLHIPGYDEFSTAQPGDTIIIKRQPDILFKVELVMPGKKVLGISDPHGKRGVTYYGNIEVIEKGSWTIPN